MLIRLLSFVFFSFLLSGLAPSSAGAVVRTSGHEVAATQGKEEPVEMGFWQKVKLLKKARKACRKYKAEARESNKAAAASGIMDDGQFRLGLILLAAGIVVAAIASGILSVFAGLVGLAGFILMIIALVRWFS